MDTPGDFFPRKKLCDKIAQPDGLTLLAIRSDEGRKSRERAHLANAGEFNCRYLTCQISAILYADRSDRCTDRYTENTWRFSPIAAIGVRVKLASVSPATATKTSPETINLFHLCHFAIISQSTHSTSTETANYPVTKLVGMAFKLRKKMKLSSRCAHVLKKS